MGGLCSSTERSDDNIETVGEKESALISDEERAIIKQELPLESDTTKGDCEGSYLPSSGPIPPVTYWREDNNTCEAATDKEKNPVTYWREDNTNCEAATDKENDELFPIQEKHVQVETVQSPESATMVQISKYSTPFRIDDEKPDSEPSYTNDVKDDKYGAVNFQKKWTLEDTCWEGKRRLIQDFNRLKVVDDYAVQAPKSLSSDIQDLVSHLTKITRNKFEEYRVLFRWIAQNIKHKQQGGEGKRPESVIRRRTAVSGGYARLYMELCRRADLECRLLYGRAKGQSFSPGDIHAVGDQVSSNHMWNEIKIGDKWYQCDCSWAAGYIDDDTGKFVADWGEVWFITEPNAFRWTHFPFQNPDHHLSKTSAQFDSYKSWITNPRIDPGFFAYGMERISFDDGLIKTHFNQLQIMFRCPYPMFIFHTLKSVSENGKDYSKFVAHYSDGDRLIVEAKLPQTGEYDLQIYGHPYGAGEIVGKSYRAYLAGYRIQAQGRKCKQPFPDIRNGRLGPDWNFLKFGYRMMTPTIPIIRAKDGKALLTIQKLNGPIKPMQFKFHHSSDLSENLIGCFYTESSRNTVKVHMQCQKPGQYKLTVYAEGGNEGNILEYCGCFLVESPRNSPDPLQELSRGFSSTDFDQWGPQESFLARGFEIIFPRTSLLTTDDGEGELIMRCPQDTYKLSNIMYDVIKDGEKVNQCVMAKAVFDKDCANVSFQFRLTRTGFHIFKLWETQDNSDSYDLAGVWLIQCDKPYKGNLFPTFNRIYGPNRLFYNVDLELVSPMSSYIEAPNGESGLVIKCRRATYDKLDIFFETISNNATPINVENAILAQAIFNTEFVIMSFSFQLVEQGLTTVKLWTKSKASEGIKYHSAGEWLIDCQNAYRGQPFPKCNEVYGPNRLFHDLGLELVSPMTSHIVANEGKTQLVVRCHQVVYRKLQMFHEVIFGEASVEKCIQAEASFEGDLVIISYDFRLVNLGFTTLRLWANTDGSDNYNSTGVWLVECRKPYRGKFFKDFNRVHGPNNTFFRTGLELVSPKSSRIELKKGTGELVVKCSRTVYETLGIVSKTNSGGVVVTNSQEASFEGDSVFVSFHLSLANDSFSSVDLWVKLIDAWKYELAGNWIIGS